MVDLSNVEGVLAWNNTLNTYATSELVVIDGISYKPTKLSHNPEMIVYWSDSKAKLLAWANNPKLATKL